ncbi:MAG: SurA N-terminal domain-containing protein [Candidatus Eutrophobiaceae bacterium]
MLMYIRDRFTGWVAKFIVGLLVVSFALWGIGLYDDQGNAAEAAHVGDVSISLSTWQRSYRDLRQKMEDKMGRVLTSKDEEFIKEQSLQGLVNNEVVNQLMEEERMQISNATLRNVLTSFQVFQAEGAGFDRGRYERAILSAGYNTADFERRLRMDLLAEQLQGALVDSSFVLNYELERLARMKNQKRDYRYLGIVAENFLNLLTMDEGQIQQWYEQNQERYREPERIRIAYVDLDAKKLRAELEYEEEELRVYYEENREQFDEEERSVSQLIARVSSAATEGGAGRGLCRQKASAGRDDVCRKLRRRMMLHRKPAQGKRMML